MFKRFVQTGRVALVADGEHTGKLVTIVDVLDQTRALVDGPETGVTRRVMRINQLHLTKIRIKFPFTGPTRLVRKSWNEAKVNDKWEETARAKKLAQVVKRRAMGDFDRFKLRKAKAARNKLRTVAYKRVLSNGKKYGTLPGMKMRKKPAPKAPKAGAKVKKPFVTSKPKKPVVAKPKKEAKPVKGSPEKKAAAKKVAPAKK